MYKKLMLSVTVGLFSVSAIANVSHCLMSAYPDSLIIKDNLITFKNGATLPIGTVSNMPFTKKIENPSVADQLSQIYPLDFRIPKQYEDAGRIRNDEFFKQIYGNSKQSVEKNLVSIHWKPTGKNIQFNKQNGASIQLEKVGNEIAKNPELIPYVAKSLGSFNWRYIAGTKRLSGHSFGIAIDFELPKNLHKYWRWDGCKSEDKICPYPKQLIADPKLNEVVKIFEKHGFIWGGKWASYDSPHFEYRPELLISACRK